MNKPQGIAVDEYLLCGCCVGDGQIRAWVDEAETGNDNRRLLKPAAGCPPVERGPSVVAQVTAPLADAVNKPPSLRTCSGVIARLGDRGPIAGSCRPARTPRRLSVTEGAAPADP